MRRRTNTTRFARCLAAAATLTLVACGSADDSGGGNSGSGSTGGGSTESFCEEIPALADTDVVTTEAEDLATLQQVADAAPSEISDEMDLLVEAFELLRSFDPEAASEDELADFLEFTEGLDEASENVEEFALSNCPDLPPDFFSTG